MSNMNNINTAHSVADRCWCDNCTVLYHVPDTIKSHAGPLPQLSRGVFPSTESEASRCSLNMPREKRGFDSAGAVLGPGPSWDAVSEEDRELEDCMIFVRSDISWRNEAVSISVTAEGTEVLKLGWKRGYWLFAEMDDEYIEDVDSGMIDREENHRPTKRRRLNS